MAKRGRKSDLTALVLDADAPQYAGGIQSGDLAVKAIKVTVDKDADGNAVTKDARTLVAKTAAGAMILCGDEAHLIRACSGYFQAAVAQSVRQSNVPLSKSFLPMAEKIAKRTGKPVADVLAQLVALGQ